jgi:hypothetical protein
VQCTFRVIINLALDFDEVTVLDRVLFEIGNLMFDLLLVLINMTLEALLSCHVLEVHFGLYGCRSLLPIQTSLVILGKGKGTDVLPT